MDEIFDVLGGFVAEVAIDVAAEVVAFTASGSSDKPEDEKKDGAEPAAPGVPAANAVQE